MVPTGTREDFYESKLVLGLPWHLGNCVSNSYGHERQARSFRPASNEARILQSECAAGETDLNAFRAQNSDRLSLLPRYCPDKPEVVKDEAGNEFTEWTFQVRVLLSSIG